MLYSWQTPAMDVTHGVMALKMATVFCKPKTIPR